MKVQEIKPTKFKTRPKHEVEEMIKKMRKENERLVKGIFEFVDAQGGWLDFSYRILPGDPLQVFKIYHGETCEIPMGVVKHLNNCCKKIRQMNPEIAESGSIRGVSPHFQKISRIRFTPIEFI